FPDRIPATVWPRGFLWFARDRRDAADRGIGQQLGGTCRDTSEASRSATPRIDPGPYPQLGGPLLREARRGLSRGAEPPGTPVALSFPRSSQARFESKYVPSAPLPRIEPAPRGLDRGAVLAR